MSLCKSLTCGSDNGEVISTCSMYNLFTDHFSTDDRGPRPGLEIPHPQLPEPIGPHCYQPAVGCEQVKKKKG